MKKTAVFILSLSFVLGFFITNANASAQATAVTAGPHVLILTDTNNEFVYTWDSGPSVLGFNLAQKVNELSSKPADFIILFPNFGNQSQALVLQSRIPGVGIPNVIDDPDPNTKVVVQMGNPKYIMDAAIVDYKTNLEQQSTVVAHEIAHFYGAYLTDPKMNLSQPSAGTHYNECMFWSGATKMDLLQYGALLWRKAGINTFEVSSLVGKFYTPETKTFSPLTLYLMGLIPKEEVPEFHIIRPDLSKNAGCFMGTEKVYSIGDFIDVYGSRSPAYPNTQRKFSVKVVMLQQPNSDFSKGEIQFVKEMAKRIPKTFSKLTSGKGKLELAADIKRKHTAVTAPSVKETAFVQGAENFIFTQKLMRGSQGNEVKELQKYLQAAVLLWQAGWQI